MIIAFCNLFTVMSSLTIFRCLRLVRAFSALSRIKGLRVRYKTNDHYRIYIYFSLLLATLPLNITHVQLILNSLIFGAVGMFPVFLVISFVYIVFGGVALQLWQGTLRNRCYDVAQVVNGVPTYPCIIIIT